ncbi:unnamed protein product [Rotaria sp. Silwood1]|nr:unnamed protein product [Rotaria sp. Silwood1]
MFIVNSVQIEDDKWERLSRQIDQSLLDIYSTQLTLFDVVSSAALRSIDPFVIAFRALLININIILRYLVQNLTEDAILTR